LGVLADRMSWQRTKCKLHTEAVSVNQTAVDTLDIKTLDEREAVLVVYRLPTGEERRRLFVPSLNRDQWVRYDTRSTIGVPVAAGSVGTWRHLEAGGIDLGSVDLVSVHRVSVVTGAPAPRPRAPAGDGAWAAAIQHLAAQMRATPDGTHTFELDDGPGWYAVALASLLVLYAVDQRAVQLRLIVPTATSGISHSHAWRAFVRRRRTVTARDVAAYTAALRRCLVTDS